MSNATQDSRNPGDSRRRRSRGGKNRRNNNSNQERRGDQQNDRGQHQGRRHEGGRSDEFRPNKNASRPARQYAPVKLTLWQKLLKLVGLYKEPTRPERKPDAKKPQTEGRSPKSNVRVARTGDAQSAQGGEKRGKGERPPRGERTEKSGDKRSRGGDRDSVESSRVYVGNLSYDVSEQDLQELFKGIGGVRGVEIVYNRTTHRSKGYGFVEMLNVDEAKRSVEVLHDQFFMGRKLLVSGAKSKGQDEREDKEERAERKPRPVVVASAAPAAVTAPAVVETVTNLQDATPENVVEAAVENVAAVGAPDVIVEAVEHTVTEAVEEEVPAPVVAAVETEAPAEEKKEA